MSSDSDAVLAWVKQIDPRATGVSFANGFYAVSGNPDANAIRQYVACDAVPPHGVLIPAAPFAWTPRWTASQRVVLVALAALAVCAALGLWTPVHVISGAFFVWLWVEWLMRGASVRATTPTCPAT